MKIVLLLAPRTLFLALVFCCVAVAAIAGGLLGSMATVIVAVGIGAAVFYFAGTLGHPRW